FDDGSFAAAVRAEEAKNFAALHFKADVVHRGELSERPHKVLGGNRNFSRWIWSTRSHRSARRLQFNVGSHTAAHAIRRIVNAHFYAENLVHAFFARLHVARQKLRLLIDLLHDTVKNRVRERIDANLGLLPDPHVPDFSFGNVDADV